MDAKSRLFLCFFKQRNNIWHSEASVLVKHVGNMLYFSELRIRTIKGISYSFIQKTFSVIEVWSDRKLGKLLIYCGQPQIVESDISEHRELGNFGFENLECQFIGFGKNFILITNLRVQNLRHNILSSPAIFEALSGLAQGRNIGFPLFDRRGLPASCLFNLCLFLFPCFSFLLLWQDLRRF